MVNKFYDFCDEITKMCFLNLLWILFTIAGGVIFGIFPATAAVFAIYRQRLKSPDSFAYFKKFKGYFKAFFIQTNAIATLFYISGALLFFEYSVVLSGVNVPQVAKLLLEGVAILWILLLIFFFPVFVHFDIKGHKLLLQPFLIMLFSPLEVLGIVVVLLLSYLLFHVVPGLLPLFYMSFPTSVIMQIMYRRFLRLPIANDESQADPLESEIID